MLCACVCCQLPIANGPMVLLLMLLLLLLECAACCVVCCALLRHVAGCVLPRCAWYTACVLLATR